MPKVNDTTIFPFDEGISPKDYLFGTDGDPLKNLANKNYKIETLANFINTLNGNSSMAFRFHDGSNLLTTFLSPGYFFSELNNTNPSSLTKLHVNNKNIQGTIVNDLFSLILNSGLFIVKLVNSRDITNVIYLNSNNVVLNPGYFSFEVNRFNSLSNGNLINEETYIFQFELLTNEQNNRFRFFKANLMIGGKGIDISTPVIKEAAIQNAINIFLSTNLIDVLETELIIFVFSVTEYGLFNTHVRKYFFPNMLGKGNYDPMSDTFSASDLEVLFIDNVFYQATPVDIESNINNVVFDLGVITGQDYLDYINTISNISYPLGYPLIDNTKIYYFKWVDDGVTYMYYFDEENSVNSYGYYGIDGAFIFDINDLVLFFNSSNSLSSSGLYIEKREKSEIELYSTGTVDCSFIDNRSILSLTGTIAILSSAELDMSTNYSNKKYTFKNRQSTPITIEHLSPTGLSNHKFFFHDENDYTLQPNEIIEFLQVKTFSNGLVLEFVGRKYIAALDTVLAGVSVSSGTFTSSSTILQAFGKVKFLIDNIAVTYQAILTDVNFGSFINSLTSKITPVNADNFSIVDSADSNKQKKLSYLDLKTALNIDLSENILQNLGVWVKFNQASAGAYPFAGAALNSGSIQNNTSYLNQYSNAHVRFVANLGSVNSGYRFSDGNSYPSVLFKGTTFFGIICPVITTNLSAVVGMPTAGSISGVTEASTIGAWFNITGNQIQAKCAYTSFVSIGSSATITATEWLMTMIEVIDNNSVNKRVRFKVKKIDGTVVYNEDITTNVPPFDYFGGGMATGVRAVKTIAPVGASENIFGLQALGFWANKPNWLKNF
jgi:hypothetical protein